MKNWWLYVLELEEGKYYVGITSKTPEERFKEHQNGFLAARWTKKYRPIKIIDTKNLGSIAKEEAEAYEAKVTRKYIDRYGLNNVRGGDLTDEGDYLSRFGRYVTRDNWTTITTVVLLTVGIILLTALYYLK